MNIKKDKKSGKIVVSGVKLGENSTLQFSLAQEELDEIVRFAEFQDTLAQVHNFLEDALTVESFSVFRLHAKQLLRNEDALEEFARNVQEELDNEHDFITALAMANAKAYPPITESDIREENLTSMAAIAKMLGWDLYTGEHDCDLESFSPNGELINIPLHYGHFCEDALKAANEFDVEKEAERQLSQIRNASREFCEEDANAMQKMYIQLADSFAIAKSYGLKEI